MEMKGSQTVAATVERTWQGLNDPDTLKACIPGCETLEPAGENAWTVVMNLKIGPVGARFKGKLALSNVLELRSYTIQFEGQGGAAGFGKGSADVALSPAAEGTLLEYGVNAQIGGRIAQVGARLVDVAAKKMADDFFARFNKVMAEGAGAGPAATAAAVPAGVAADIGAGVGTDQGAASAGLAVSPSPPVLGDAAAVQAAAVPASPAPAGAAPMAGPAAVPRPAEPTAPAPAPAPAPAVSAAATSAPAAAAAQAAAPTRVGGGKSTWIWWLLAIIILFVLYLMFRG